MWKKSKRILLCILALMLLLSMAKSEQLFVQADMESTEKVQTKDVKNRSQRQEENSDEKGQEESTDKKEEASTKATQKTEETIKEDKKNLEATTQKEKDASKNDEAKEETEEKTEEYKREEEKEKQMRIKRRKRYLQNRTNMVSEGFYDYRDNKGHQCSLLGTTLGAFCVFFLKNELSKGMQKALMGFAAGVMVAASIWSLLLPALEQVDSIGVWKFLPAASGFWIGILFLMAIDHFAPSECIDGKCKNKLLLAVTIHNIPEGMAVGVIYAGLLSGAEHITVMGAFSLALGIVIQNFPEGAIISLPLRAEGISQKRAFIYGVLSGAVEPVAAILTVWAASLIVPLLPYFLSFAAGAMFYVVVEELVPKMSVGKSVNVGFFMFSVGFTLMMILDVALA